MEPEIKRACSKAAAKLGIGLSLLAAVIGIRLVTAMPEGIESGIEELERLEAQIGSESNSTRSETPDVDPASGDSIVSRLGAGMLEHMPDSDSGPRDGDKLVSCRLGASTHFMRAGDCSMRGGDSTIIKHER
jgi:hypothetical protein